MLAARELATRGRKVVILERGQPGREASWASAGMVGSPPSGAKDSHSELWRLSASLYLDLAAALRDETGMDIELVRDGWITLAWTQEQLAHLEQENRDEMALGQDSRVVSGTEIRKLYPQLSTDVLGARVAPGGQTENRRLVLALERAAAPLGISIEPGMEALQVQDQGGGALAVDTISERYQAPIVVVAAGSWSGQIRGSWPKVPVIPERGQILALRGPPLATRPVFLELGDLPYLVPRADGRLLVGATRERVGFDRSLTAQGIGWLLHGAAKIMPCLAQAAILETWCGFRPISPDDVPIIGPGEIPGLFFLTGHGTAGVGPAPGSARLLAHMICGEPLPFSADLFNPARFAQS